jgi:hypothetical protein
MIYFLLMKVLRTLTIVVIRVKRESKKEFGGDLLLVFG